MTHGRWIRACVLAAMPSVALAADEPRTWFELHATDAHWRMTADSGSLYARNPGTPVSAEDELGLPRRKGVAGIAFGRLIGERWRIEIEHTAGQRTATTVLAADARRGEITYLAGTPLESRLKLTTLRVNGGWAALKTDEMQAVLLIGGEWLRLSQRQRGTGTADVFVPGNPTPTPTPGPVGPQSTEALDLTLVPLLGVLGQWQPTSSLRLQARAEAGCQKVLHLAGQAQWRPSPHVALGAGYRFMRGDVDSTFCYIGCTRFISSFRVHGPALSAQVAF